MEGKSRVQSTADPKNGRFRHMSGARQTRYMCTHTHTHTYIYTRAKTTQTEGHSDTKSVSQSGASRPLYHSIGTIQKPTWLKLDLSSSAQTVSITSESFGPDWRHSVTLVIVTASLWQMCALVHVATDVHTVISKISFDFFFFLVSSERWRRYLPRISLVILGTWLLMKHSGEVLSCFNHAKTVDRT